MAAVYARFKDQAGSWKYAKVGKGRPPKDATFVVRFTDATGKRRWSQPFPTVDAANSNSDGVKIVPQIYTVNQNQGVTWSPTIGTLFL
jgi:hypothetical protein